MRPQLSIVSLNYNQMNKTNALLMTQNMQMRKPGTALGPGQTAQQRFYSNRED